MSPYLPMIPGGLQWLPEDPKMDTDEHIKLRTRFSEMYIWNASDAPGIYDRLQYHACIADKGKRLLTTAGLLRDSLTSAHEDIGLNYMVPSWTGDRNFVLSIGFRSTTFMFRISFES